MIYHFIQTVGRFQNLRLKRRLNHAWHHNSLRTDTTDQDQIWTALEPQLKLKLNLSPLNLSPHRKPRARLVLALPLLALTGVAAMLAVWPTPPQQTLKDAGETAQLSVPNLVLAAVDTQHNVRRLGLYDQVTVGTRVIFGLEAPASLPANVRIDVSYNGPEGASELLTKDYAINGGFNYLKDSQGYLAFTPNRKGVYVFAINRRASINGQTIDLIGSKDDGTFAIEVVDSRDTDPGVQP